VFSFSDIYAFNHVQVQAFQFIAHDPADRGNLVAPLLQQGAKLQSDTPVCPGHQYPVHKRPLKIIEKEDYQPTPALSKALTVCVLTCRHSNRDKVPSSGSRPLSTVVIAFVWPSVSSWASGRESTGNRITISRFHDIDTEIRISRKLNEFSSGIKTPGNSVHTPMSDQFNSVSDAVRAALLAHTGIDADPRPLDTAASSQINRCLVIEHGQSRYFIKLNTSDRKEMFEAELEGLLELAGAGALIIPEPVCCGDKGSTAFLIMEYLDLKQHGNPVALGEGLALMHLSTREQFGWKRDNTIGLTPQINHYKSDWLEFWSSCRLGFQLELAAKNGFSGSLQNKGERLLADLHGFFESYQPRPALLHGDLWSGNFAYLPSGDPVVYDPAVYYGDREADLAMTELFGGFSQEFYSAYRAAYEPDPGYRVRKHLYNLYHILNHLNLFGGGYLAQAQSTLTRLLGALH
jgi:fructosamine-3-kinase